MAKMEGIMCLKKGGYGFSKRNNGIGSFSCTSDGNNRGAIEEAADQAEVQNSPVSAQPEKSFESEDYDYHQNYVADEAKVVGGGDMDHDFFFGDGALQNDPNKPMVTDLVNFEISIGGEAVGDVSLGLFGFVAPKTAKNFAELAKRPVGEGYLDSIFHRVIAGFMAQGGDFTLGNGRGGHSIYGAQFDDEPFTISHKSRGMLSMANAGPDTNGSQFFITFTGTPFLDGKHVVFGKLVKGHEVLDQIEAAETDAKNNRPFRDIRITKSQHQKLLNPFPVALE
ncbi:Oidioi.mRNA.OKI2018_I69.XSR.g13390.t1.cds [Oikopleura dioica]|uniref:Peptidyl-prolyl cis-trans isomerase n=1 Tax=Oikopleura dioica TaxID=34765 RepID=A0ABN7SBF1_OIKDI|nr:Oidioi.mRNA.OKI2018_I69.XSR.g13390.t1.cds [Oikopleura dioica]